MILGVLDVETTGLDPNKDALLELALLVYSYRETAADGTPLPDGLLFVDHSIFYHVPELSIDQVVRDRHTKNGLWDDCKSSSLYHDDVDGYLAKRLPDGMIPCGRNVHFDLDFLKRYMPELSRKFSHRHLDLTTIDYLRGRTPRPSSTHRALHDAMSELLELTQRRGVGRTVLEELA